jgi:hypothetical protein
VVQPTDTQKGGLDRLSEATSKAVGILQAARPDTTRSRRGGRLEAMQDRLATVAQRAKTVQPALVELYALLSNEQKARFDRLGLNVAQR